MIKIERNGYYEKTMIALLSLTLTGAMSCPAFAAVTDAPSIISNTSATDDAPFVISGSPVMDETLLISPNPFIDCNTLSDASKIAGFSLKTPDSVNGCPLSIIQAIDSSLIQAIYQDSKDEIFVRKAAGNKDVSGDYNVYSSIKTVKIKKIKAELRGDGSKIYTAIWTRNNHSYSISSQSGLSRNKILKLIQKIR